MYTALKRVSDRCKESYKERSSKASGVLKHNVFINMNGSHVSALTSNTRSATGVKSTEHVEHSTRAIDLNSASQITGAKDTNSANDITDQNTLKAASTSPSDDNLRNPIFGLPLPPTLFTNYDDSPTPPLPPTPLEIRSKLYYRFKPLPHHPFAPSPLSMCVPVSPNGSASLDEQIQLEILGAEGLLEEEDYELSPFNTIATPTTEIEDGTIYHRVGNAVMAVSPASTEEAEAFHSIDNNNGQAQVEEQPVNGNRFPSLAALPRDDPSAHGADIVSSGVSLAFSDELRAFRERNRALTLAALTGNDPFAVGTVSNGVPTGFNDELRARQNINGHGPFVQGVNGFLFPFLPTTYGAGPISPATAHINDDTLIKLEFDDRMFAATIHTLTGESNYFKGKILDLQTCARTGETFRLETDPDIFPYILDYLETGILPVVYDIKEGFDFPLYRKLFLDARTYGIHKLYRWIGEAQYLAAVTVKTLVFTAERMTALPATIANHPGLEWCTRDTVKRAVWVCPREIYEHHRMEDCDDACEQEMFKYGPWPRGGCGYGRIETDVPYMAWGIKEVTVNHEMCWTRDGTAGGHGATLASYGSAGPSESGRSTEVAATVGTAISSDNFIPHGLPDVGLGDYVDPGAAGFI
jgi:hypothetical protein